MIRGFLFRRLVFFSGFGSIAHDDPYNCQGLFQSVPLGFAVGLVVKLLKPLENESLDLEYLFSNFFGVRFVGQVP